MANPPIITPTTATPATPFGIGVAVVGGVAGEVLFVDAAGLVGESTGLAFDTVNQDLSIGRDLSTARDVRITRNLGINRGNNAISNPIEIGQNNSGGQYFYIHSGTSNQQLWIYNSGGSDIWAVGKQLDDNWIFQAISGFGVCIVISPATSAMSIGKKSAADASALLDLTSITQGLLAPRMTTTQKAAISSPATGLCVYDTSLNKLSVYTGAGWETVTSV